jgi:hypothetical protein
MRTNRSQISELRHVIDCMPLRTRVAMLEGVRTHRIIAGAYTDRDGGVCPMLAAHRCGGRTDYVSFARAWDRFTGVVKRRSRRASDRELQILDDQLEASIMAEERIDLADAIADHRRTLSRTRAELLTDAGDRPGDPNRAPELRRRSGWAWLRPFRRLDDYNRALDRLQADEELLEIEQRADESRVGEPV